MISEEFEQVLIAKLRADRTAGEIALIRASFGPALRFARRVGRRIGLAADEAEEVVGDALLAAVRSFNPDGGSRWSSWAHWRVRDALRSHARRWGEGAEATWWRRSEADLTRSQRASPGTWGTSVGNAYGGCGRGPAEESVNGPPDADAPPAEHCVDARRDAEEARRVLASLDDRTRAIVMAHAQGETPTQIAPRIGLSRNWVTILRDRGLTRLRHAMRRAVG